MSSTVIPIPALLDHQTPIAQHPARFKVLREGRRWGKDRIAFNLSWFGHGPDHALPGIVDGWDVAWLAPDYSQARIIWEEEIEPRFRGVPGVQINATDHAVTIPGYGSLHLRSSENMTSIRGLGKRLIGVIVNEAAHLDLAYAWRQIIRPALADNKGWAVIMSTTNSGTDGGLDEQGNRRVPSYFNTLCDEIRGGKRSDEWMEFSGDASVNSKIEPEEFKALVGEYPQDSVALNEEIYAKLLPPGSGAAFPEWRDDLHVTESFMVPKHWGWGAGFDWGYWQPSVLTIVAHGEESKSVLMQEIKWVQKDGFQIGLDIAQSLIRDRLQLEYIACDSSMWGVSAKKGFVNMAEEVQSGLTMGWKRYKGLESGLGNAPALIAVAKGPQSRLTRANLLHRYLKWERGEDGKLLRAPRLTFLKRCGYCVTTIPKLPVDPAKPEDVDTTSDDHGYDSLTYYLLSRPPLIEAEESMTVEESRLAQHKHPGFDYDEGKRKKPYQEAWQELEERPEWVPSTNLERL